MSDSRIITDTAVQADVTPGDRLSFAVFLAAAIHASLILGITFTVDDSLPAKLKSLEVTLARHWHEATPEDADFLAQANQLGSGELEQRRETTTTEISEFHDNTIREVAVQPTAAPAPAEAPEDRSEAITTTMTSLHRLNEKTPIPDTPKDFIPELQNRYLELSRQIATLEARLAAQRQIYAKRPRIRRLTSVSTRRTVDAYYLQSWRRKVETLGNLNYPQEARRRKLYGSLRLLVAIKPDGSLKHVKVLDSSGHKILDEAAVRIVKLAAPYTPFPEEMRREVDVLEIIRTWQFRKNHYLSNT
ncbi:MAG: energy transducer TonB [Gammaproteobacteria bacterium]|nr:energy transducer TonB [Gammaproteobacteria bacterium]